MSKEKRKNYGSVSLTQRAKRVEKVNALRASGKDLMAACESAGLGVATYHRWKRASKGTTQAKTTKRKYTKRAKPERIEITEDAAPGLVTVFRGTPSAVAEAMRVV